jgi:tetratricopeptide (TPR) repeat protein
LVVAWRRRGAATLAACFTVTLFLATVLVFVAERYKLDALPGTLPLALLGVREAIAQVRRKGRDLPLVLAAMLLLLGGLLSFHGRGGIRTLHPAHAATLEGVAFYKERQWVPALERLQLAVQEEPQDADAHMTLGTTLQQLGRLPQALLQYQRTHELVPEHPRPLLNAGWIERAQGDLVAARVSFEAAIKLDDRDARARFELATVLEMQGNRREAMEQYAAAERLATDPNIARDARQRFEFLRRRSTP